MNEAEVFVYVLAALLGGLLCCWGLVFLFDAVVERQRRRREFFRLVEQLMHERLTEIREKIAATRGSIDRVTLQPQDERGSIDPRRPKE